MIFTKIAIVCFTLGVLMSGAVGITLCYELIKNLNSTLRTIIYIGISIIIITTLCIDLSYMGIPYVVIYFMIFTFIGFCSWPIRIFIERIKYE